MDPQSAMGATGSLGGPRGCFTEPPRARGHFMHFMHFVHFFQPSPTPAKLLIVYITVLFIEEAPRRGVHRGGAWRS